MNYNLKRDYEFVSPENEICEFINTNKNTIEILNEIRPDLVKYFPDSTVSLEISDELDWTTERKLLVNVSVEEETFFNGMLTRFNEIYQTIDYLIEDIFCPIVLFPKLGNDNYDRMSYYSPINLIARTAYFNSDFDKNMQREMTLRDIPKSQKKEEILEYLKNHPSPDLSDIVFDLRLDLFDVDEIIDELKEEGKKLDVKF